MDQLIEIIAILSGITSVWFSRKENIWVYPTGLIGTILYVYISFKGELYGEASVNLYYTIMSVYGWYNWLRRDEQKVLVVQITHSSKKEWWMEITFFLALYLLIYLCLTYIQQAFSPGAIPWADALASAAAFTGMWLMTRKKVNSWIWWIITNICSIPLYYTKGYTLTSWYYFILLILAVMGWIEWRKKANEQAS